MGTFLLQNDMWLLLGIMTAMSLLGFVLMCVDKHRACRRSAGPGRTRRRIRERTLLLTAVLLGSFGILAGMLLLRHKTNAKRHPAFVNGVPVLAVLQGLGLGAAFLVR